VQKSEQKPPSTTSQARRPPSGKSAGSKPEGAGAGAGGAVSSALVSPFFSASGVTSSRSSGSSVVGCRGTAELTRGDPASVGDTALPWSVSESTVFSAYVECDASEALSSCGRIIQWKRGEIKRLNGWQMVPSLIFKPRQQTASLLKPPESVELPPTPRATMTATGCDHPCPGSRVPRWCAG
jgi:hypothetical protein